MKDFVLDLWHDLREKRLWPIAAILAIALAGVPILLLKGAPEKAEPPVAAGGSQSSLPIVSLDGSGIAGSSKLGSFDSNDPFRSRADKQAGPASAAGAAPAGAGGGAPGDLAGGLEAGGDTSALGGGSSSGGSTGADAGSGAPAGGSGGGSSSAPSGSGGGSSSPPSGSGGGSSSPPSGSGSGGSGSGSPTPSPAPPPAEPRFYQFVVEVDFGPKGREKRYRDVRALDALPSKRKPVLVYLGQTRDNESSFLVNQANTIQPRRSEGNCVPSRGSCNFVYLRPERDQDDFYFVGPKGENHLRLIAVKRKLDNRDASARSGATSSEARTRVQGAQSERKVRRTAFDFRIPLIAGRRR